MNQEIENKRRTNKTTSILTDQPYLNYFTKQYNIKQIHIYDQLPVPSKPHITNLLEVLNEKNNHSIIILNPKSKIINTISEKYNLKKVYINPFNYQIFNTFKKLFYCL